MFSGSSVSSATSSRVSIATEIFLRFSASLSSPSTSTTKSASSKLLFNANFNSAIKSLTPSFIFAIPSSLCWNCIADATYAPGKAGLTSSPRIHSAWKAVSMISILPSPIGRMIVFSSLSSID